MPRDTSPIVLGIHGFGRKPRAEQLESSWELALEEGLRRNCGADEALADRFEMVYWYDNFGGEPIEADYPPYHRAEGDGPFPSYEGAWLHDVAKVAGEQVERLFDRLMSHVGLHDATRDLLDRLDENCRRYHAGRAARESSQDELARALRVHRDRRVLLIAHSVGSVIAYETLRQVEGESELPEITLYTTGSPLGMPFVTADMDRKQGRNRVPHSIREWINFADRRDPITLDAHLKDDYPPNDGGVEVEDRLVYNAYELPGGERSLSERLSEPHSVYGYLRTPELSHRVRAFLAA